MHQATDQVRPEASMESRLIPLDGFQLRLVPTSKFKTAYVQLRFSAPFRRETLNLRALLPYVLLSGTRNYPTKRRFQDRLDDLYGTQIGGGVAKQGRMSVISFSLSVVMEQFLPGGAKVFADALDLFQEVVFSPRRYRGGFRKGVLKDEVRMLREDIEADYADKAEFSFQRMAEHMFKDELARYRPKGDEATLDQVTPEALWEAYRDMLQNDHVEMTVVGDFSDDLVVTAIRARFSFPPRATVPVWVDTETKAIASPAYVTEHGDVSQARLQIGYRVLVRAGSPDYFSMLVANALFGDSDTSMLFRTVRERDHLCYYVYSAYAAAKGAVFVSAGVEPGKAQEAARLIESIRRDVAEGGFSESDLDVAKRAVIKRMRQATDSPRGIVSDYAHFDRLYGRPYDLAGNIAKIGAVTKEQVMARMDGFILDTVYELTRGEA